MKQNQSTYVVKYMIDPMMNIMIKDKIVYANVLEYPLVSNMSSSSNFFNIGNSVK